MQKVQSLDDIRRLVDAGSTVSGAIKEAIAQHTGNVSAFALKYGVSRPNLAKAIAGVEAPTTRTVEAFVPVFGGTELEWRVLFHQAADPLAAVG